jgi:peptide/nickel transport system permease protein
MIKYTIRRLIQAVPTLFGITLFSFLLLSTVPGGAARALTFDPKLTPQQRERIARQLGLDDPWPVQYIKWLIGDQWRFYDKDDDGIPETRGDRLGILRGDFGNSFYNGRRSVFGLIMERVPATLELGVSALLYGLVVGIPIGIWAAVRKGRVFDSITRVLAVITSAVPIFWLGLVLILLFGRILPTFLHDLNPALFSSAKPILPMGGRNPPILVGDTPPIWMRLEYLILPTFVLGSGIVAVYSRYLRASMLDVIGQDYVRTAKAKGLSARQVWFKHGARNALIPVATFLGPQITGLLSGAVLTETIFSWPGLGRFTIGSTLSLDYPVVMAVVVLASVATVLGFILSDILYALVDPRIRFS